MDGGVGECERVDECDDGGGDELEAEEVYEGDGAAGGEIQG